MNLSLSPLVTLAVETHWAISALGLAVTGLAFLLGQRLLAPARAAAPPPAPDMTDDRFLHGVTIDRRAAPRRKGNSVEVYLADQSLEPRLNGWVLDRSVGGLCLMVEKAVPEGTILNVRARTAPETTPWAVVEVKTCRPDKGDWELGCRFVQTPSWNVLLHFG